MYMKRLRDKIMIILKLNCIIIIALSLSYTVNRIRILAFNKLTYSLILLRQIINTIKLTKLYNCIHK